MKISQALKFAVEELQKAKINSAFLDAEVLLLGVLNKPLLNPPLRKGRDTAIAEYLLPLTPPYKGGG